jgi:hypothetical protein
VPSLTVFESVAQTAGPSFLLSSPGVGGTGTVTASIATLANGQSASFQLVVRAGATSSITNTANISTTTPDLNTSHSVTVTTGVVIPLQLTLFPNTVADGSPSGTLVGTLAISLPVVPVGQFVPPLYTLPPAEAANASFRLAPTATGPGVFIQFQASYGTRPRYPINVHVDIGFGDQVGTLTVDVLGGSPLPVLNGVQVVRGGKQGQPQELVLAFSTALDPGGATSLGHYAVQLGFKGKGKKRRPITVPLFGAAYDPSQHTITLLLGKVKGPQLLGTLMVQGVPSSDGVLGDPASMLVDLHPHPRRKH